MPSFFTRELREELASMTEQRDALNDALDALGETIATKTAEHATEVFNLKGRHFEERRVDKAFHQEQITRLTEQAATARHMADVEIARLKGILEERERDALIGRLILQDHDWHRGGSYNHNGRTGVLWNAVDTRVDKMSDFRIGLPEGVSPRREVT